MRRLRILIKHLPGESKLARLVAARRRAAGVVTESTIEDADPSVWSQTEWMLVHLHDQISLLRFAYLQAHTKNRLPLPALIPRPGSEPVRRTTLNAWFGAVGLGPTEKPTRTT